MNSWLEGTVKQYAPHLSRRFRFCSENWLDKLNADVISGAEFLTKYLTKTSCDLYQINTARSPLSSILPAVNGFTFGEEPLIKRLLGENANIPELHCYI